MSRGEGAVQGLEEHGIDRGMERRDAGVVGISPSLKIKGRCARYECWVLDRPMCAQGVEAQLDALRQERAALFDELLKLHGPPFGRECVVFTHLVPFAIVESSLDRLVL